MCDDGKAGAYVLFAEFFDDFRAGGGLVADGAAADLAFEFRDQLLGKAVRVPPGTPDRARCPAISQWSVVVSFPGETVAPLP